MGEWATQQAYKNRGGAGTAISIYVSKLLPSCAVMFSRSACSADSRSYKVVQDLVDVLGELFCSCNPARCLAQGPDGAKFFQLPFLTAWQPKDEACGPSG
ncbi:uncharacterized protein LOC119185875 [Rhipicephalus microplus]|uniref:uncharacterized protein LOC119185875 n=1 Tax=Rhipicephalus microplus TaxID=6941 RepID=UPI003F6CD02C